MSADWLKDCAAAASMLTQPQRQSFLDLVLAGKTIGDARDAAGLSFDAAIGTINQNIENASFLRTVAK